MPLRRSARSRNARFCSRLHSRSLGNRTHSRFEAKTTFRAILAACACLLAASLVMRSFPTRAQTPPSSQADLQKSIDQRLGSLRELPDEERAHVTKQLALDIRRLSQPEVRVELASSLANLATEGDFGRDTLQEVTTTLAESLRAHPVMPGREQPAFPYVTLAQLAR